MLKESEYESLVNKCSEYGFEKLDDCITWLLLKLIKRFKNGHPGFISSTFQ